MKIKQYHVQEKGLHQFMGSLEAQVMEIVWASGRKLTIKQVLDQINQSNSYSINTIMTVLIRLSEKGLLTKETTGQGRNKMTLFHAVCSKESFLEEQTKNVARGLITEFGESVVCHMVDVLEEADPHLIKLLEQKLQELNKRNPS
jgi:predicted transcriptional regulator